MKSNIFNYFLQSQGGLTHFCLNYYIFNHSKHQRCEEKVEKSNKKLKTQQKVVWENR